MAQRGCDSEEPPDSNLVEMLSLLGRALGNPLRVRIATALLGMGEASPRQLANLTGGTLGNVSYHLRYLRNLGFLQLQDEVQKRGSVEHFYALGSTLRQALWAATWAIERETLPQPAELGEEPELSEDELFARGYFYIRSLGVAALSRHATTITRLGEALSDQLRVEILGVLLVHDQASVASIAETMDTPSKVIAQHLREMADLHMVRPTFRGQWTVTRPMRTTLGGLYEYLIAVRDLGIASLPPLDSETDQHGASNGNGERED